MPKINMPKGNVTLEKLSELPFKNAKSLKEAQDEIRLQVWKRLEEAKVIDELLKREEYQFWKEEFKEGFACSYGETNENLVRVYSEGRGLKININKALASALPSSEQLLEALVRSMADSFAATFYCAKGILPPLDAKPDLSKRQQPHRE